MTDILVYIFPQIKANVSQTKTWNYWFSWILFKVEWLIFVGNWVNRIRQRHRSEPIGAWVLYFLRNNKLNCEFLVLLNKIFKAKNLITKNKIYFIEKKICLTWNWPLINFCFFLLAFVLFCLVLFSFSFSFFSQII